MCSRVRTLLVPVLLSLLIAAARAGTWEPRFRNTGGGTFELLGSSVARVPDLNGDGIDDILVGIPGAGLATVVSGEDGTELLRLEGRGDGDFGWSVCAVGDLDGDGLPDLLAGCPSGDYATVCSGRDGSGIWTVASPVGNEIFGASVAGVGDADGDGTDDFAVGAPGGFDGTGNATGYVTVWSGRTGGLLHRICGVGIDEFGWCVAGGTDSDGDGHDDFIVGAPLASDPYGRPTGSVTVFSGRTGAALAVFHGTSEMARFGSSVALAGDVDADGITDILVGAIHEAGPDGGYGLVRVLSGADGGILFSAWAGEEECFFGHAVCGLGDVDRDGTDDFAAGGPGFRDPEGAWTGAVRAWSGATGREIFTIYGRREGDAFGHSLCALGDAATGEPWGLVTGAAFDSEGGEHAGSVVLLQDVSLFGRVRVNGGAACTRSRGVTLSLRWVSRMSPIEDVRIRNEDGEWGDWRDVAGELAWTLSAGDGEKTVEVEFRAANGATVTARSDPVLLDTLPPAGGLVLAAGAPFTGRSRVSVEFRCTDEGSGVHEGRLRNSGGGYGPWLSVQSFAVFDLTGGEGRRIVEGECRDLAGNVSDLLTAEVLVDATPPSGTIRIEGGAACTRDSRVTLDLEAWDSGGSSVSGMRLKNSGLTTWGAWVPCAPTAGFVLTAGVGPRGVDVQFVDGAGNLSPVVSDTILLDDGAPCLSSFLVNTGLPYVLPGRDVPLQIFATDGEGSGVAAFRVFWDDGAGCTDWRPWSPAPLALPHPGLRGEHTVQAAVRDAAGNCSALSPPVAVVFLDPDCPRLQSGGSFSGSISSPTDVDAVIVDVARGDALAMKVRTVPADRGAPFRLVFDVWLDDGTQVAIGVPALRSYVPPRSGPVILVARVEGAAPGLGSWVLGVRVKQARSGSRIRSTTSAGVLELEAAEGSVLTASLAGEGLDPAAVEVVGPAGTVALVSRGRPGSVRLSAVLDRGTGTYRIRFAASGSVGASLTVRLPKGEKAVES